MGKGQRREQGFEVVITPNIGLAAPYAAAGCRLLTLFAVPSQLRDMLAARASLPRWMTSILSTPLGKGATFCPLSWLGVGLRQSCAVLELSYPYAFQCPAASPAGCQVLGTSAPGEVAVQGAGTLWPSRFLLLLPVRHICSFGTSARSCSALEHVLCTLVGPRPPLTSCPFSSLMFSSVGQVVNIKAKVNRAFNSSMEVCVLQPCFAPCVHPWHVAVPASCTLCAVATCRIPAYCSVLWLRGCAVYSAHSGSAWGDATFTHAPAAAWAPNCSLSPVLGFKIPNYAGHHCASPAAFSPLLSQEEIFGVRNPCMGLQKLPALCWWCWLNISPCHPYMWLRGPVLCPLSGGHPGELRGPAQREALQHLQGLCHLRGAGSPRHQGKCCAVSPVPNLQETTSAIGAGGRWGCA